MSMLQRRRLDLWPGAVPTELHVSQFDDIQLRIDPFHSKVDIENLVDQYSYSVYLEGTRSDKQELSVRGTITKTYGYPWYMTFNLNNDFTAIPGKSILQIRIYSGKDIHSSKIILIVEPQP